MVKQRKSPRNPFHAVVQVSKPQLDARPYGDPPSLLLSQLSHLPTFSCRYPSISFIQHPSIPLFFFPTDSILFICPPPPCYRAPATPSPTVSQCYLFSLLVQLALLASYQTPIKLVVFLPYSRDVPVHSVWGGGRGNTGWTRHRWGRGHGGEHGRELPDQRGGRPVQSQRRCRVAEGCCLHQEGAVDGSLHCSATICHNAFCINKKNKFKFCHYLAHIINALCSCCFKKCCSLWAAAVEWQEKNVGI